MGAAREANGECERAGIEEMGNRQTDKQNVSFNSSNGRIGRPNSSLEILHFQRRGTERVGRRLKKVTPGRPRRYLCFYSAQEPPLRGIRCGKGGRVR